MPNSKTVTSRRTAQPKRSTPSTGPYRIVNSGDLVAHLISADNIRIALLDDAHASEEEVAATQALLRASWELWAIVTEFVADVEAIRVNAEEYLREEWPDLNDTYNHAVALIGNLAPHSASDATSNSAPPARDKDHSYFVQSAKAKYSYLGSTDRDIDFDDEPVVSASEDGAYIQMWGWIPRPEDSKLD